jgi:hypothetical protein
MIAKKGSPKKIAFMSSKDIEVSLNKNTQLLDHSLIKDKSIENIKENINEKSDSLDLKNNIKGMLIDLLENKMAIKPEVSNNLILQIFDLIESLQTNKKNYKGFIEKDTEKVKQIDVIMKNVDVNKNKPDVNKKNSLNLSEKKTSNNVNLNENTLIKNNAMLEKDNVAEFTKEVTKEITREFKGVNLVKDYLEIDSFRALIEQRSFDFKKVREFFEKNK